jgi:hypothetical protein
VLAAFVPVVLLLGAGVALGRLPALPESSPEVLHKLVIQLCLPATIVLRVPGVLTRGSADAWVALVPWALALGALAVVPLLSRVFRWPSGTTRALVLTVGLGNTSFLGYPVVRALLGEEALGVAVVLDQLGSFLALATLGTAVATAQPSPSAMGRAVATFPPFAALVVAAVLALSGLALPAPVHATVELLSAAMLPLVLLALGLGLKAGLPTEGRRELAIGLALRMIVAPAAVLGVLLGLGLSGTGARVALLESAMPPMVTAAVLAQSKDLAPELAGAMAGVGLVGSLVTLPVVAWIAESWL